MQTMFEHLYDVLFQPRMAMRHIATQRAVGQAFLALLLSLFIPMAAVYFGLKEAGMAKMIDFILLGHVVCSLMTWFIGAALWQLIAEFFGGKGTALGLLAALGFAQVPHVFIVPLWVVAALLPTTASAVLMALAGLVIMVWTLFLTVTAIREAHEISGSKAVLVLLTPLLALLILCIITVIFIGTAAVHMPTMELS